VHIHFNPDFDGVFEATLELVFYDNRRSARFVVSRALTAIAGSVEDHRHYEPLDQEINPQRLGPSQQVLPQEVILLSSSGQRRKSKRLPEYELPPEVQSAVDDRGFVFDIHAPLLLRALNPTGKSLNMETYSQYFKALLNVEDGHQQYVQ
jgi:helicase MOV-10